MGVKLNFSKILVIVVVLIGAFFGLALFFGFYFSAPVYKGPVSDHFDGKRFYNPWGIQPSGTGDLLKWLTSRDQGSWAEIEQPFESPGPPEKVDGSHLLVTFINHATVLIQWQGLNIITDPVYSERVSPFSFLGPKRFRPPGVPFDKLPKIDVVLLTHNHYDHLDIPTLKNLVDRDQPQIITPLGVGQFVEKKTGSPSHDMDWWDAHWLSPSIQLYAVPTQHFSGRGMMDRDRTLWCGYVLESGDDRLYFAGDTGYNEILFKEIGQKFGPFRFAMIPIGAYKPEWFMAPVHTSPEEGLKVHLESGAAKSMGIHFGTFPLADDGMSDPENELKKALEEYGISEEEFVIPIPGVSLNF